MPSPYVLGRLDAVARQEGVEVEVVFRRWTNTDRHWRRPDLSDYAFTASVAPTEQLSGALRHLIGRVRDRRPDVVIALHEDQVFVLGIGLLRAMGIPVVLRVLPTWTTWFPRRLSRELVKHLVFRLASGAKVSGIEAVEKCQRYGMPAARIRAVVQSIDLAGIYRPPAPAELPAGRSRRIAFAGRLEPEKGFDRLLAALPIVRRRFPDVELHVWGTGSMVAELEAVAARDERVFAHGFVEHDLMPEAYREVGVLVLPSTGEPHGLVIDEALSQGCAVVASATTGAVQARVRPGVNGAIDHGLTPDSLASAIIEVVALADDPRTPARCIASVEGRGHDEYARQFVRACEAWVTRR